MINLRNLCVLAVGVLVANLTSSCFTGLYLINSPVRETKHKKLVVETVMINHNDDLAVKFSEVKDDICLVARRQDVLKSLGYSIAAMEMKLKMKNPPMIETNYLTARLPELPKGKAEKTYGIWQVKPYPPWPPEQTAAIHSPVGNNPFKFPYPPGKTHHFIQFGGNRPIYRWHPYRAIPLIITVPLDIATSPIQIPFFIWLEIELDNAGFW